MHFVTHKRNDDERHCKHISPPNETNTNEIVMKINSTINECSPHEVRIYTVALARAAYTISISSSTTAHTQKLRKSNEFYF